MCWMEIRFLFSEICFLILSAEPLTRPVTQNCSTPCPLSGPGGGGFPQFSPAPASNRPPVKFWPRHGAPDKSPRATPLHPLAAGHRLRTEPSPRVTVHRCATVACHNTLLLCSPRCHGQALAAKSPHSAPCWHLHKCVA
jgi:hypothetical protein